VNPGDAHDRRLALVVEQAGGQLPEMAAQRVPVLVDQRDLPVRVRRDDRDRAVVLDDLALGRAAAGHLHLVDAQRQDLADVQVLAGDRQEVVPPLDAPAVKGSRSATR
jgi:hypothetical protein